MRSREEAIASGRKWFPYKKGGEFRRWYGNDEYVVNWEKDGAEIRTSGRAREFQSCPECGLDVLSGVSWSKVTAGRPSISSSARRGSFRCGRDNHCSLPQTSLCSDCLPIATPRWHFRSSKRFRRPSTSRLAHIAALPVHYGDELLQIDAARESALRSPDKTGIHGRHPGASAQTRSSCTAGATTYRLRSAAKSHRRQVVDETLRTRSGEQQCVCRSSGLGEVQRKPVSRIIAGQDRVPLRRGKDTEEY